MTSTVQHKPLFSRRETRILLGTLAALLVLFLSGTRDAINRAVTDRHQRWWAYLHPAHFPTDFLIIGVDERTLIAPPSRTEFATVVNHLAKARLIVIDYLFSTPSNHPADDRALAAAVLNQGNVYLPLYLRGSVRPITSATQAETDRLLERFPEARPDAYGYERINGLALTPPYNALLRNVAGLGFADLNADHDNVFRHPILLFSTYAEGRVLPHLSLAAAAAATRTPLTTALRQAPGSLVIGDHQIPLTASGGFLFRPYVRRPFTRLPTAVDALIGDGPIGEEVPTISFADVLSTPAETFRNKVIFIGETRPGTTDIRPVATDNGLRGVELTAQITANLIQGEYLRFLPFLGQLALLLVALLPIYLYQRSALGPATIAALLILLGLIATLEALFWVGNLVSDTATLVSAWFMATLLAGQQRAAEEYQRRELLRSEVAAYVSQEVVDEILLRGGEQWESPRRQRMAVLFADIRDFTQYTESNPPDQVQRQLTEFMGEMTEAVFARQGFLDKFIGDAVMVLFDPFRPREKPAVEAVLCALEMLTRLERLNHRWEAEGLPIFRIGIGIHVGEVLFGNMSSRRRKTLTAIGDNVNLGARIEAATKEYGVSLLVSQSVRDEAEPVLSDRIRFLDKGVFVARGRNEPTHLFAICRNDVLSSGTEE